MSMLQEFREFALKGSVVDLAIGVVIGATFGAVVNSFVNDIVMPPIGLATGGIDFKDQFVALNGQSYASLDAARKAGAPVIAYGAFINTVVSFFIITFVLFLLIKQMNRLRRSDATAAPTTRPCPFCDMAIPLRALRCPHCTSELQPAI